MPISRKPYAIERIISATSYLSAGFTGIIWLIIAAFSRKSVTPFIMYHVSQAIFLSILFFLVSIFLNFVYVILYKVPILNAIPYFFNLPLIFNFSIVQIFTTLILIYSAITSALGFYSYLPWVSDIIKANTRNY